MPWQLGYFTALDWPPVWRLRGFPDEALPPSHTQEMLLGKILNVKMTAREHLSACDGPLTNRLLIFTGSSVTEGIAWAETIKEILTCFFFSRFFPSSLGLAEIRLQEKKVASLGLA